VVRVVDEDDVPLVRQGLQAQEYWRLKGLSADVVILNEHPVGYLDEMHAQITALLDTGPWRAWQQRPGGVRLAGARRVRPTLLVKAAPCELRPFTGGLARGLP
jgi:cyclic beta-1,2-glucan synthetase